MRALGWLFVASVAWADVSNDVARLTWRRAIDMPADVEGWFEVSEDDTLAARSRDDLGDIRIVTSEGSVLPVTRMEPALTEERLHRVIASPLADATPTSEARPGDRVIELDTASLLGHDMIVTYSDPSFHGRVRYEAQSQSSTWTRVAARQWIRRDVVDRGASSSHVHHIFPNTTIDRLRVVVVRPGDATGDSVFVATRDEVDLPAQSVAFEMTASGFDGRDWWGELTLTGPRRALGRVEIGIAGGMAPRKITIEVRHPDGGWRLARAVEESLPGNRAAFAWPPFRTDALRVKVWSADPPNVPVIVESLAAYPVRFVFYSPPTSPAAWVAYGDPFMRAPVSAPRSGLFTPPAVPVGLRPPELNPWDRGDPGPGLEWAKRRPWFIPAIMIALLVAIGFMVFRWRPTDDAG